MEADARASKSLHLNSEVIRRQPTAGGACDSPARPLDPFEDRRAQCGLQQGVDPLRPEANVNFC